MYGIKDFSYFLPEELIAQRPCENVIIHACFFWIKKEETSRTCFFSTARFVTKR